MSATSDRFTIRSAKSEEKAILEAIQWSASLTNPEDREMLLQYPDAIELPESQIVNGGVFVAELSGEPIGFAAIFVRDDGQVELDGLFVEPEHWRKGIGRHLVAYSEKSAQATGAAQMYVVSSRQAQAFYESCGFITTGVSKTRFGKGLVMHKVLN